MGHLSTTFPDRLALNSRRREDWGTQVNVMDGGLEVRNNSCSAPLLSYEISMPPMLRTDADYIALKALFLEAQGSLHSFNFLDWTDGSTVKVRFDTSLPLTGLTPDIDKPGSITLIEVRDYDTSEDEVVAPDPPEFIASGTHVAQTSSPFNVAYPAGLQADDIAILQATYFDSTANGVEINIPSGWNELTRVYVNGDTGKRHALLWRRLVGSESGSVTVTTTPTASSTDSVNGKMSIFRGVRSSGDPYENFQVSNGGNDTTPNAPNINTFGENRLICNFWGISFPGSNFQPGTGYTEYYDVSSTAGVDTGLKLTGKAASLPVTQTGETASIGSALPQVQNCISVALVP